MSYKTFKRSAVSLQQFATARKITDEIGLTYEQARAKCELWNAARTAAQIRKGTKLEFTEEGKS